MNKLEQAAQQALEALREYRDTQMIQAPRRVIEALREALAEQAEQEPVASVVDESEEQTNTMSWILSLPLPVGTKLYAAPVRTKDLTDDEINDVMEPNMNLCDFARAVIAADREKNNVK